MPLFSLLFENPCQPSGASSQGISSEKLSSNLSRLLCLLVLKALYPLLSKHLSSLWTEFIKSSWFLSSIWHTEVPQQMLMAGDQHGQKTQRG